MAASSASACPASDSASIRAAASAASLSRPCTWPWPTAPPASRTVARVTVISPRLKGAPVAPARPRTITVPISGGRSTSWAGHVPPMSQSDHSARSRVAGAVASVDRRAARIRRPWGSKGAVRSICEFDILRELSIYLYNYTN
jgi:hypothetical protein